MRIVIPSSGSDPQATVNGLSAKVWYTRFGSHCRGFLQQQEVKSQTTETILGVGLGDCSMNDKEIRLTTLASAAG